MANRLRRLSTFDFLVEGVVHDVNNGNLIRSKSLHAGETCQWSPLNIRFISASLHSSRALLSIIVNGSGKKAENSMVTCVLARFVLVASILKMLLAFPFTV